MPIAKQQSQTLRILAVDDEEPILQAYKQTLSPVQRFEDTTSLNRMASELFESKPVEEAKSLFDVDVTCCNQSQQALDTVKQAMQRNEQYAVAFLDVRMPPGDDGIWLAEQIRRLDPSIQIVIVTGYSDTSPSQISHRVPPEDKLFYIQKPFHHHELQQFAVALGTKWFSDAALQQYRTNLESMVQQRTAQLQAALAEAQAATVAKSQFLANMSHEIRTPLNAIIGFADILQEESLCEPHRSYVRSIATAGKSLLSVVNDILDFSKIEAGKMGVEIIDSSLPSIVGEVMAVMDPLAAEKQLALHVSVHPAMPETIRTDPTRLRQCLINLIANAVKFTRQGQVVLRISPQKHQGAEYLLFQVEDTGIGIPAHKLTMIFDSFTQADNSNTREYGGTGLGLAITKRLVELMDGSIHVTSTPGVGSMFAIRLPVNPRS